MEVEENCAERTPETEWHKDERSRLSEQPLFLAQGVSQVLTASLDRLLAREDRHTEYFEVQS